jgi:hypothetical protein
MMPDARIVAAVMALAARHVGVDMDEAWGPERGSAAAALARHIAIYLCVVDLEISRIRVAAAIGRDRTTVGHAVRRIEDRRDDATFEAELLGLEARLADLIQVNAGLSRSPLFVDGRCRVYRGEADWAVSPANTRSGVRSVPWR